MQQYLVVGVTIAVAALALPRRRNMPAGPKEAIPVDAGLVGPSAAAGMFTCCSFGVFVCCLACQRRLLSSIVIFYPLP